jgi:hypothetical protein
MLWPQVEDELFGDELVLDTLRGLDLEVRLRLERFGLFAPLVRLQFPIRL